MQIVEEQGDRCSAAQSSEYVEKRFGDPKTSAVLRERTRARSELRQQARQLDRIEPDEPLEDRCGELARRGAEDVHHRTEWAAGLYLRSRSRQDHEAGVASAFTQSMKERGLSHACGTRDEHRAPTASEHLRHLGAKGPEFATPTYQVRAKDAGRQLHGLSLRGGW